VAAHVERDFVVAFVGGSGRSGSTILDMMLGGHQDALSLGQIDQLRQWVDTANVCTCGRALSECPLWSRVLGDGARDPTVVPPGLNVEGQVNKVARIVPALVTGRPAGAADPAVAQTWDLLERVAAVSGARVLVDSSKSLLRFAKLAADPARHDRLRLVHIVRDPRGYVASRSFSKPAPSARGFVGLTEAQPRSKAVSDWIVQNLLTMLIGRLRHRGRYRVVTYETLVARPEETLRELAAFLGIGFSPSMLPPMAREDYHLIGGNSARLAFTELRPDTSWEQKLTRREQRVIWVLGGWLYRALRRAEARG
jgi:hypothetical protein